MTIRGGWNLYKTYTADGTGNGFEWRVDGLTFKECQEIKVIFKDIVPASTTNINIGVRFKGYGGASQYLGFQHASGFTNNYFHYNEFEITRIKNGIKVTEKNYKGKNSLGQTNTLNQETLSAVYIDENVCGDNNPIVYINLGTSASVLLNSGTIDVYIR